MRFFLSWVLILYALQTAGQSVSLSSKPTRTVFSIKAIDDKTEADVPAHFVIKASLAKKQYIGDSKPGGEFEFILNRTDTLDVIVTAKGYHDAEELMVVSCDTCPTYGYAIRLEKADSVFRDLQVNQAIRLDKVYFDQSSYHMRAESYEQLDKLVRTLQQQPSLSIEIAGHTDNVGDRRLNQLLSENRAKVITNYLVRSGVPEQRLRYNGYGDSRPAAPNDIEENKSKNRRVEFVVLRK